MEQKSYIREWANQKQEEAKKSDEISPNALFGAMIYALSTYFTKENNLNDKNDHMRKLHKKTFKKYSGDSSLFEIGCYLFFRTDLWLFRNEPEYRESLSSLFAKKFNGLFSEALKINNVAELLDERIKKYGEMIRKGKKIDQYHHFLAELIKRTGDDTLPTHYGFENSPIILVDIMEEMFLKVELVSFEKFIIPAFLGSLERYFKYIEKA